MGVCYNYGCGVKNASEDKKRVMGQLNSLKKVLEAVGQLVEDEKSTAMQLPALTKLLNDPEGLPRCHGELKSLQEKLEPKHGRSHLKEVLAWPLKAGDTKKILDFLAQFQRSLGVAMNVDQT